MRHTFNVIFEFETLQEAKECHNTLKPFHKNITKIKRAQINQDKRINSIMNAISINRLTTKQIYTKVSKIGYSYHTLGRDLKYLVLREN